MHSSSARACAEDMIRLRGQCFFEVIGLFGAASTWILTNEITASICLPI